MTKKAEAAEAQAATQDAVHFAPSDDLVFVAVDSMAGDIRDFLLDRLKHDHSALPWHMRGEEEQGRYIEQADVAARRLVARVAHLIASRNRPIIGAHIKKAAMKDVIAIEAHVGLTHPMRHELLDSVGHEVLIVLSGVEEFMGDRGKPKVNKDQGDIFPDEDGEPSAEDA